MNSETLEKIYPSEEKIAQWYVIIQANRQESVDFSQKLDDLVHGKLPSTEVITVGKTPNVLQIIGSNAEVLTVKQSVLKNCLNAESTISHRHTSGHDLPLEVVKQLPKALRNPVMICNGSRNGTVVAITELKNRNNKNIVVPIAVDIRGKTGMVCSVLSAYGKDNLQKVLDKGILAQNTIKSSKLITKLVKEAKSDEDRKKASELFTVIEANSSQATSIPCYDDSITYTTENVKYPSKNSIEKVAENVMESSFEKSQSSLHDLQRKIAKLGWRVVDSGRGDWGLFGTSPMGEQLHFQIKHEGSIAKAVHSIRWNYEHFDEAAYIEKMTQGLDKNELPSKSILKADAQAVDQMLFALSETAQEFANIRTSNIEKDFMALSVSDIAKTIMDVPKSEDDFCLAASQVNAEDFAKAWIGDDPKAFVCDGVMFLAEVGNDVAILRCGDSERRINCDKLGREMLKSFSDFPEQVCPELCEIVKQEASRKETPRISIRKVSIRDRLAKAQRRADEHNSNVTPNNSDKKIGSR